MLDKNIVLIGFMGVGKSTVGYEMAKTLNYTFYDCDEIIKRQFSMKVSEIFEKYGEVFFREMERKTIKELSKLNRAVISTGGGAVLNPNNITELKKNGVIYLLEASPATIFRNISNDKNKANDRPLLKCNNPLGRITEMLQHRQKYYNCYDLKIDTDSLNVDMVVSQLIESYLCLERVQTLI